MKKKNNDKPLIGFIGTGFIGKNYADCFEERGYKVIRYSLDPKYVDNKNKIKKCDIVFIAVPTPTTPKGVDFSILENVITKATKPGQIIVIKSTMQVGKTEELQQKFNTRYLFHSPEFLTEKTAKYDAMNPDRNIVGYTSKSRKFATRVISVLPSAPYEEIVPVKEAEMIKYAGNVWFFFKVLCMNMVYDIAIANGLNYDIVKNGIAADKRVGRTHLEVSHQGGRGAGGHCFIKDFEAFRDMYISSVKNTYSEQSKEMLKSMSILNRALLHSTKKDIDLLVGVFGNKYLETDIFDKPV
jgi:nucleotide sugar dehydrogenase